jgi:hypothetical protein
MELSGELEVIADAGRAGFLVHGYSCDGVFDGNAGAVENNNFFLCCTPRFVTSDNFSQFGVSIFFSHQPLPDCVMQLTDRTALVKVIGDDFAASEQRRIDLLFVFVVCSDSGDESAWGHIFFTHKELAGRGTGRANITFRECTAEVVDRFDLELQFTRQRIREIFSADLSGSNA